MSVILFSRFMQSDSFVHLLSKFIFHGLPTRLPPIYAWISPAVILTDWYNCVSRKFTLSLTRNILHLQNRFTCIPRLAIIKLHWFCHWMNNYLPNKLFVKKLSFILKFLLNCVIILPNSRAEAIMRPPCFSARTRGNAAVAGIRKGRILLWNEFTTLRPARPPCPKAR